MEMTRRRFVGQSAAVAMAGLAVARHGRAIIAAARASPGGPAGKPAAAAIAGTAKPGSKMRFGLCTYLWGQDWDLPTLIGNLRTAGVLGVELRTQHRHGVEPTLSNGERSDVRKLFADSKVTLVGLGSNECFDSPDPEKLNRSIERAKAFLKLSRDVGASGVKVKPNDFHDEVPRQKTIEQIGRSLNELGGFAAELGQQVRLEVHGSCCELPTIKAIMDIADHPSVAVCWNSNDADLRGLGLEHNFGLVSKRLGATVHVRELNAGGYPYQQLIDLLVKADYAGWVLLEASSKPADRVKAISEQHDVFRQMVAKAQASAEASGG